MTDTHPLDTPDGSPRGLAAGLRFDPQDRQRLLTQPQIGPVVVQRLEAAGFDSLQAMRCAGLDAVVAAVCRQMGGSSWRNRRRALARALDGPC
jgi:hypothetical protein